MTKLFHQCGHNFNWNKESYLDDECGNGLIFSPIHQSKNTIESLDPSLKEASIFDPQYYLPSSQKKKLKTYEFFPETISEGFNTADFSLIALESARMCVNFQIEQNFSKIIIPARHFTDMVPDFVEKQNAYTLHPFLQALSEVDHEKDIYLTVSITKNMILNDMFRTNILNWITSYPEIDGIYLLIDDDRTSKQIQDENFLIEYMKSVKEMSDVGLKILLGHQNTEGLLFTMIENCDITYGAYENTRIFSIDKFVVSNDEMRGPKSRLYLPGLLNWIQFSQARQIRSDMPDIWDNIYDETEYAEDALRAAAEPHFTFPALYKHFFVCYQNQVNQLNELPISERYDLLKGWLRNAAQQYEDIESRVLDLDRHGRGDHIQPWIGAINSYKRNYLM